MPATLIGTLLIMLVCCGGMALIVLSTGRPLHGGCSKGPPGTPRCEGCPERRGGEGRCDDAEGRKVQ